MNCTELKVKVSCDLTVDEETAKTCLQLVQLYLNGRADIQLVQTKLENGEVELNYEPA